MNKQNYHQTWPNGQGKKPASKKSERCSLINFD